MTGPDAFCEAQRHLEAAARHCDGDDAPGMQYELGSAIVHALLANAAATALGQGARDVDATLADYSAWRDVASVAMKERQP
jgi:hypothetical protein